MARYAVRIRTARPPVEAFAYLADLRNFAEWDPGVVSAEQVEGEGGGPGASFDLAVKGVRGPLVLRYHTTVYEPPERVVVDARSSLLRSVDTITVEPRPDGDGSIVTYDAVLTLNGPLGLADPVLGIAFGRIADRAAAGLVEVLDGERVGEPSR